MTIKNRKKFKAIHGLWLLILLITLFVQLTNSGAEFRFDRKLIDNGHFWLIFSGHFVHLNWMHWLLNMGGLAIVAFFFSLYGNLLQWLGVIILSALFVGLGLYWFNPEVGWYVGLSGVLHGLFLFGALHELKTYRIGGAVLLIFLVSKLVWEMFYGALPGSQDMTGAAVITDAHLYGAIGGFVSSVLFMVLMNCKKLLSRF